jgi:hypothetical protein
MLCYNLRHNWSACQRDRNILTKSANFNGIAHSEAFGYPRIVSQQKSFPAFFHGKCISEFSFSISFTAIISSRGLRKPSQSVRMFWQMSWMSEFPEKSNSKGVIRNISPVYLRITICNDYLARFPNTLHKSFPKMQNQDYLARLFATMNGHGHYLWVT